MLRYFSVFLRVQEAECVPGGGPAAVPAEALPRAGRGRRGQGGRHTQPQDHAGGVGSQFAHFATKFAVVSVVKKQTTKQTRQLVTSFGAGVLPDGARGQVSRRQPQVRRAQPRGQDVPHSDAGGSHL